MEDPRLTLSKISEVCDDFEAVWLSGHRPDLKNYLHDSSPAHESLMLALLHVDLEYRNNLGETPNPSDYEPYGSHVVNVATRLLEQSSPPNPAVNWSPQSLQDDFHASTAGRYRLLEPIGTGGTGTVWKAEQLLPVKRLVAVKLLRADYLSKQAKVRFFVERQLLALLKHPNIPTIYDGGETEGGHPYLIMEFIDGVPITTFCDQQSLGLRAATPR